MGTKTEIEKKDSLNWRNRAVRVGGNLALALVALFVSFGATELAIRIFAPQQLILKRPDIWVGHDIMGWAHHPNINTTINSGERTVSLFTDHEGWRVPESGRTTADRRVLVLGDSFMEAVAVEYEQSVPGLLEQHLTTALGQPVSVRNTGVGQWDPNHYLLQLHQSLSRESFDAVVVSIFLGNDIVSRRIGQYPIRTTNEIHRFRFPTSLDKGEIINAIFYPINDALEVSSHLFTLFKTRSQVALMRAGLSAIYLPNHYRVDQTKIPAWGVTAEICRDIAALATRHGTPTFFFLIPQSWQVDEEVFDRYLAGLEFDPATIDSQLPNRALAAAMGKYDLDFVDVTPELKQTSAEGRKMYGIVDEHLSPDGHSVVAETIRGRVTDLVRQNKD